MVFNWGNSFTFKLLDQGILETVGPSGMYSILNRNNASLSKFQSGYLFHYIFSSIAFILFLLSLIILSFSVDTLIVVIFCLLIWIY